jgi:hypothetical protein
VVVAGVVARTAVAGGLDAWVGSSLDRPSTPATMSPEVTPNATPITGTRART